MSTITAQQFRIPRSSGASRRPSVRLTRRGRFVVVALTLMTLFAIGILGANIADATSHGGPSQTHVVTVTPGDTLWDIASEAADGGDVRAMEQRILDLNGLTDSMLLSGQRLQVPN
ncbi:MAG: LysM peptidoglycan-binding domain-containing protein [Nocardioides sp.]|uniref:LysM peptidoglycan-binding domain-containing protein n=1 Tax=Nocardioides sp. TaxID=35761 RepID=UPI0039E67164